MAVRDQGREPAGDGSEKGRYEKKKTKKEKKRKRKEKKGQNGRM